MPLCPFAALLLLCAIPPAAHTGLAEEQCDLIEVNHFYDEHGRLVFDQVIFSDWDESLARYQVRAWRLLKTPAQLPQRDLAAGGYVTTWHDGDQLRRVKSLTRRETWTQVDPELAEREHLPKHLRRGLLNTWPQMD